MAKFNISNQEFFESNRFYDADSRMQKKISAKIKEVFARLFKGTDINLDNFYFLGYDSKEPNAFKADEAADKTVIAVSYGLIQALNRTEEFAAVIAHECGHYIWKELIGGENSIIQERSSDVHSVDMMINGGYNPRYILTMQRKIFGRFSNTDKSLDVHGSAFNRMEDVKAYLTKIASEQGDFPDITNAEPDAEWLAFQKELEQIYKEDGYDTFMDKELKKKFGTKDVSQLSRLQVLNFLLDCINNRPDLLSSVYRTKTFCDVFRNYNYSEKTEEETKVLQDIFISLCKQARYSEDYKIIWNTLKRFELDIFGPFLELYDNIENLVKNCYDKEEAKKYAKKIVELSWVRGFTQCVNFDGFPSLEPLGKDNIGKKFPWDQLRSYAATDPYIYTICEWLQPVQNQGQRYVITIGKYEKQDYFLNKDGIVVAYGEDAHNLYNNKERLEVEDKLHKVIRRINVAIQLFEHFIKYANGEISYKEFDSYSLHIRHTLDVKETFDFNPYSMSGVAYLDANTIQKIEEYNIDYTHVRELYEKIKETTFYKDYIGKSREITFDPDWLYKDGLGFLLQRISVLLNPINYSLFNEVIMNTMLKYAYDKSEEQYGYNEYLRVSNIAGLKLDRTSIPDDLVDERYQNSDVLKNFRLHSENSGKEVQEYNKRFKQKIFDLAVKDINVVKNLPGFLGEYVRSGLESERPSEAIEKIMKTLGILKMPTNAEELKQALQAVKKNTQENGYHENTQLMFVLWAEYLKNGYKCNPIELLDLFRYKESNNKYVQVQDIFGKYITVQEFKSLTLSDKAKLYEFMGTRKLFSEKTANKNAFIQIIVNEIVQSKTDTDNIVKNYVEPLLTRQKITVYGEKSERDLSFANEREKLIDFYAKYWANKLGKDDGSQEYLVKVKELTDFITSTTIDKYEWNAKEERLFSQMIAQSILNKVSDNVVAQERAAKMFADAGKYRIKVDVEKTENYDWTGRSIETLFSILAETPQKALRTIKFLNEKLTDDSVEDFLKYIGTDGTYGAIKISDYINKESLTMIHENFWIADLPVRAYVMNKFLNSYSTEDKTKLDLVIDTYFDKNSEYYKDAVIVLESVYNNLQDYEKGLILSALLSAGQNEDKSNISNGQQVGRGLKMFFQAKGGAFVKFGQLLSYLPTLDSDIRKELATLREKANLPTRDELYEMLKMSLPESEFNKISYVGKILGGGSIYVTVHVKYDNQDCVIAVMRPHTRELMAGGIDMISRSIDAMAKRDKKFEALKNIVTQAKLSCESEIDVEQDYEKYTKAVKIYEKLNVHTPNADYSPYVERWIKYGADDGKNNAYKIMEMAQGESLTSAGIDEEDKHDMAIGYVALELAILLSGVTWDTDRHMGQQNFYNRSFRDFCVGIFDTGAQMSNEPVAADKIMLGHLLYELIRESRNGKSVSETLNSSVKFLDSLGKKLGIDTVYIDGVQRGLIALSDIIEYQKEIKDEDGNIIQEHKTLTEDDLQNVIVALMNSGIIDKTVMKTIRAKAILNKLRVLRPGWFKTLSEGFSENTSNIVIEYTGNEPEVPRIDILRKAKAEIEKLLALRESKKHLGIDNDVIIKPEDTSGRN